MISASTKFSNFKIRPNFNFGFVAVAISESRAVLAVTKTMLPKQDYQDGMTTVKFRQVIFENSRSAQLPKPALAQVLVIAVF